MLKVKNKVLGSGKPLICISVMDSEKNEIIAEVKRLIENGAEMIEWRVDAFSGVKSPNAVREVLYEVAPLIKDTIFVFTFRSKEQGGMCSLTSEKVYDLHQVAAESKVVDFIDVEYFYTEDADVEVYTLQKMGTKVITSHHDFHETPSSDVLFMLLEQMNHSNADIVKLAMMPNSTEDVLRLLTETNHFHKRYPKQPLITMAMGKLGVISRVAGETFGSCVTFGAGKNASAPGQVEMTKLQQILDALSGE
ncbi:MAG: type I 3-dehydroquinate dehydratase [Agathobacter sp.]|nr:type I 3-dehydroquinate dehydratase [Agathobacter sp.]